MEFWIQYNHALDAQQHADDRLDYMDTTSVPTYMTRLNIEKHAGLVYTFKVFGQVQHEIVSACFDCSLVDMRMSCGREEVVVKDRFGMDYVVVCDKVDDTYTCGCKMFGRIGILCCHIIFVLKNRRIDAILDLYLNGRWMTSTCAKPVHGSLCRPNGVYVGIDEANKVSNELMYLFFGWHQRFEGDVDKLKSFIASMDDAGTRLAGNEVLDVNAVLKSTFEKFYGDPVPVEVEVLPPLVVKTKGSCSRLISRKEKAIRDLSKPLKRCAKCKQLARHDARNCDKSSKGPNDKE